MVYADLNLDFNSHHKSHSNIYEDKKYISKNHLKKKQDCRWEIKICNIKFLYKFMRLYKRTQWL